MGCVNILSSESRMDADYTDCADFKNIDVCSRAIHSELVAERIRQSPNFDVGILGQGMVDKKHAIDEVQKRTSIGRALIDVEQRMIRMLIKRALEGNL